jgi:hypothetical protein
MLVERERAPITANLFNESWTLSWDFSALDETLVLNVFARKQTGL